MSNVQRLRWLCHVVRMDDGAAPKEVFQLDVKKRETKSAVERPSGQEH